MFVTLFRSRLNLKLLAAFCLSMACCCSYAQEFVSRIFSDHMVMQRGMPVPVWGWVDPGEVVTVSIDGQTKTAKANGSGKWMVRLDPMQAGAPRKMTVTGKSGTVEINDILLGEVWVASGQSNMAWLLKHTRNGPQEIASAANPDLRFFNVSNAMAPKAPSERLPVANPQIANMNVWLTSSPATVADFSAVAYFFARDLQRALRVPVGIISSSVGFSPIEAWISRDALMADANFKAVVEYYDGITNYVENTPTGRKELAELTTQYDARQAQLKASGKPLMWPPKYLAPLDSYDYATTFYNAKIHPLIPFAIRGVIWYQGEAQANRMYEYRSILPLLIKDWRVRWGEGEFPFIYVQLPNWATPNREPDPGGGWALIRESQLMTLQTPRTGMAVTIDVGEGPNIHPSNKQDVGARLALAARGVAYDEKIVYSGPIYRSMSVEGHVARISFNHVGSGLMAGKKVGLDPTAEDPAGVLKRFAIAGEDLKFVWADAAIDKDTVVVSSPSVPKPVAVRYAWENNPEGANLYNRDGLPASPFKTDESKPVPSAAFFKSKIQKGYALQPSK